VEDESEIVVVVPLVGRLHTLDDELAVAEIFELSVGELQNGCDVFDFVDHPCD
jgi:hypothetical protein